MKERNLPIKIFEKRRKVDDKKTEGGGDKTLPKWAVLSTEDLLKRADDFKEVINELEEKLNSRSKDRDFIPVIVELEMHESATAKSHRTDISTLFSLNSESNLIGFRGNKNLLLKLDSENIQPINNKLSQAEKHKKGIASITEIKHFKPRISVKKISKTAPLKASLINFNDYQLNLSVSKLFEKVCRTNKILFKKTNYTPDLIIYRLINVSTDAFNEIKEFDALEAISSMPKISVTTDEVGQSTNSIEITKPQKGKSYPIVGVLDTGIKNIPHLKPWLLKDKYLKVPLELIDYRHGTFVAGIIVYGDSLEGTSHIGNDGCYLYDATVHPGANDTIEEYELIENIREVIEKKHKEIKIWNLSLGTKVESDINDFSEFGKALDYIQEKYGVLICKSAGNCDNFLFDKPVSRIANSADSIRSIVVASLTHKKGRYDMAEKNNRSPFSRIGKAPSYINKPDLTHMGGNAGKHPTTGKITISGVNSFDEIGGIVQKVGTSFSTPRITSLVAGIDNKLNEEFNPLLLKALSIHSAKYPLDLNLPNAEKIKSLGYGVPSKIDDILYNDPYEITLILQDTLTKGNWLEIADFPFPQSMIDGGFYYGEIILTLISAPILSDQQGAEYCQSNLEVRLGTYDNIKTRSGKTIINNLGLNEAKNLLNGSIYGAKYQKNHIGDFAKERTLIKYGDKYQPVKKYAINLTEATPANKNNYLKPPKKWFLAVEGFYRDHCIEQYSKDGIELSQEFCLIVTIRDNKRQHRVYDLSTKLLNDNGFIHSDINLNSKVTVSVTP